jgi:hypothetical protein
MPAPGAKCVACIRRAREARTETPAPLAGLAPTADVVQLRDRAILDRLARGPAGFDVLIACLPAEPQLSSLSLRESACQRSLTRLTAKQKIKVVQEGYALA